MPEMRINPLVATITVVGDNLMANLRLQIFLFVLTAGITVSNVMWSQQIQSSNQPLVTTAAAPTFDPIDLDLAQLNVSPHDGPANQDDVKGSLLRPIQEISLNIQNQTGQLPQSRAGELLTHMDYRWPQFEPAHSFFAWESPNIGYQPLYFEDVALERYGQTCRPGRQVLQSTVHFGASFLTLPYHLFIDPSWNCETPYGYCRPGEIAPFTYSRFLYRH